jgi:hypothetical protein
MRTAVAETSSSSARSAVRDATSRAHGVQRTNTMQNKAYRVRAEAGGWLVIDDEGRRASTLLSTKGDAVVRAKELARSAKGAQVIVHGADGHIESEFFYMPEERELLEYDDETSNSMAASHPVRASRPSHA